MERGTRKIQFSVSKDSTKGRNGNDCKPHSSVMSACSNRWLLSLKSSSFSPTNYLQETFLKIQTLLEPTQGTTELTPATKPLRQTSLLVFICSSTKTREDVTCEQIMFYVPQKRQANWITKIALGKEQSQRCKKLHSYILENQISFCFTSSHTEQQAGGQRERMLSHILWESENQSLLQVTPPRKIKIKKTTENRVPQ